MRTLRTVENYDEYAVAIATGKITTYWIFEQQLAFVKDYNFKFLAAYHCTVVFDREKRHIDT